METLFSQQLAHIETIVRSSPACERIIAFLATHQHAVDTADGIAACWIGSDAVPVGMAVDRLTAAGAMESYRFSSGIMYGLTRDPALRATLVTRYGAQGNRGDAGGVRDDSRVVE